MRQTRLLSFVLAAVLVAGIVLPAEAGSASTVELPVSQERSVEAVVLTGSQFAGWSAGPELSAREPTHTTTQSDCPSDGSGNHNCSQPSRVPKELNEPIDLAPGTAPALRQGVPVDRLVGYRWDADANTYAQIPFQVDERFTRYISNLASNCTEAGPACVGFGGYSGADPQLSYVYDREGYRFTEHDPSDPCRAIMEEGDGPEADPVPGLDDNDEVAFLYRDTGGQAPPGAPIPDGITELRAVRIEDPSRPGTPTRYAYVGLASEDGPTRDFGADNGYMRYVRDATADIYAPTSSNYGNAPRGPRCDEQGNVTGEGPRRPRDTAWVTTPRYAFRYDARWVLRGVRVAEGDRDEPLDSPSDYGPPLVDQWKARAYQQAPGQTTPCCGFQTEQDDWGSSSVLLGERSGPVRVIRTTWGANSGTNTVRQEIFYPDVILQQSFLRVHPIPPLGGIFSYWDHSAGVITKYYNPQRPEGVDVDGRNDEVVGTMYLDPGSGTVRDDDDVPVVGPVEVQSPVGFGCFQYCSEFDVTDPTLQAAGNLSWRQVDGPYGSMVFRSRLQQVTPGGAQAFGAIPYYRDDARFDDGTGIDPGPHLNGKNPDTGNFANWPPSATGEPREYWEKEHGIPTGDTRRWFQGAIGSHGVQVLIAAETDNAFTTLPATELQSEERMVILEGDQGNVGDRYGRANDLPLQIVVGDTPTLNETTITVTGDTGGRVNDHAELAATLEDQLGAVADASLRFTFQGMAYDATTGEDGRAAVTVGVRGPAGTENLVVSYSGDLTRSPSFAEAEFTVAPEGAASDIAFRAVQQGKSDQVIVNATLVDAESRAGLDGRDIDVLVDGALHATMRTGEDGEAHTKFALADPEGRTFRVEFAGDDDYVGSAAEGVFVKNGVSGG